MYRSTRSTHSYTRVAAAPQVAITLGEARIYGDKGRCWGNVEVAVQIAKDQLVHHASKHTEGRISLRISSFYRLDSTATLHSTLALKGEPGPVCIVCVCVYACVCVCMCVYVFVCVCV